jgi:DNA mismatch repair protein MutS
MGHRVAVCEQLEDPAEARKRGGKSVVRRDVIRLVTPGTLTEDTLLDARRNNYLLAIARARASAGEESRFAIAWIDISTGEFRIAECDRTAVAADIARLEPGEIIVSDALYGDPEFAPYLRSLPAVTPLTRDVFDGASAERGSPGISGFPPPKGSARSRGSSLPPPPPASPMWSARSSASARRSRRRCASRKARRS